MVLGDLVCISYGEGSKGRVPMKHICLSFLIVMLPCVMSNAQNSKAEVKGRQPANHQPSCMPEGCEVGDTDAVTASTKASPNEVLAFQLFDVYGRQVDAADYAGVPVLIFFGSCWCGGCMEDTKPFCQLAEEYAGKGLVCIRTVAGDNELAALDFQNHFRLPMVHLMDPDRAFEKRYNRDGWTFLMLCDRHGRVVHTVHHFPDPGDENWKKLRAAIDGVLSSPVEHQALKRDGTIYMPATLKRSGESQSDRFNERFASMTCAPDGKMYLVFTAVRNESCDVLLRWFDGTNWSRDIPIAATSGQEYDATVLADGRNRIWICRTAGTREKRYEIMLTSFTDLSRMEPAVSVAHYEEDAMHGRMACDKNGGIWVTYYKWYNVARHGSRGKKVCLRRFEHNAWSQEVEISPTDVPQHEKHFDPAIWPCENGVIVAWSWDFHPPNKGYSVFAESPTIFIRPVDPNMGMGRITSVSGKNIDLTPAVGVSGNHQVWSAWDSQSGNRKKQICIANPAIGSDLAPDRILALDRSMKNVCTPTFVPKPDGGLTLLWSETKDGQKWMLREMDFNVVKNQWSQPQMVETQGNPRFAGGAYDKQGHLWVAYSAETERGREIFVKKPDNLWLP
jgi:thiol-disulfide isomerase/thioredoxin